MIDVDAFPIIMYELCFFWIRLIDDSWKNIVCVWFLPIIVGIYYWFN
jgi:hypothetical protein